MSEQSRLHQNIVFMSGFDRLNSSAADHAVLNAYRIVIEGQIYFSMKNVAQLAIEEHRSKAIAKILAG